MNYTIPTKLEIDVLAINELQEAIQLAIKSFVPAIVVHSKLIQEAIILRGRMNGRFKIITPIDWPKGEKTGIAKWHSQPMDVFEADGFEIVLAANRKAGEINRDIIESTEFVKEKIGDEFDVRFTINSHDISDDGLENIATAFQKVRQPSLIRSDTQTKTQQSKANVETHNKFISTFKKYVATPLKVSGNINDLRTAAVIGSNKLAVNLVQAKSIIKEFTKQSTVQSIL